MKISQGIKDTDYVAAILSKNSVTSDWVQKELSMAMYKEINGKKIVVLPLLIDECQIPFFLKDKLYADFTNPANFDSSFSKLLEVIGIEQKVGGDFIQTSSTPTIQTTDLVTDETESKEIKIIGADKKKTYKPDEREILYNVYFKLSDYPPEEWVSIFETERRFPRHTMWRKAWIEDDYIVVHCCLDEIKKYHLKDIKEDVLKSNIKYKLYIKQEKDKRKKMKEKETQERKQINDAFDGIEF
jgi:hypothetical protein